MKKKNLGNIIKGWFTSIVGGATMIVTLVLVWTKAIDFVWEGIAGLAIGTILVLMPETIEKLVMAGIKSFGGRSTNSPVTYNNTETKNNNEIDGK